MRYMTIRTVLSAVLLSSAGAHAHAFLDYANPRVGSTVASSPGQITLHFTQRLEPKFSRAEVHNAAGARVDQGASISGNVMRVSLKALSAGTYRVHWRVLSVDTHTTEGSFSFHVAR
jgi:methionine-rich copper-binding protein CopC